MGQYSMWSFVTFHLLLSFRVLFCCSMHLVFRHLVISPNSFCQALFIHLFFLIALALFSFLLTSMNSIAMGIYVQVFMRVILSNSHRQPYRCAIPGLYSHPILYHLTNQKIFFHSGCKHLCSQSEL